MNNLVRLPSGKIVNLAGFTQAYWDKDLELYIIEWANDTDAPYYIPLAGEDARAMQAYIRSWAYNAI